MTRKVVSPIALDKSINTTEQTPRNIADVLAQQLAAIKTAIESGNGNLEAAFVCYYGVTTATQIKDAIEDGNVPYFYYNGAVAQLWKVETNKYTFRTTNTRSVDGQTILDVVDYVVNGSVWSTITREVSGGSSSGQSYIASVNSLADFDTTGKSGMQDLISVANVPADGVYQVSVMLHITPKTASATKSDLVFHFTSGDGTGWPNHTFHAVVDDSQTFAQQLSFSTSVSLKAGQNTLRIQCGGLNTEYLVFVDELTLAQIVNGVYHNGDNFDEVHTLPEAAGFNNDDGVLVDGATGGPRFMLWRTLANKVLGFIKDLSTTITAFRTGDVIPVDGPSGTAKMSKDDLLKETADNALGSIHSLSDTATEDDLVASNYFVLDGEDAKKLPAEDVAKRSVQDEIGWEVYGSNDVIVPSYKSGYVTNTGSFGYTAPDAGYTANSYNVSRYKKVKLKTSVEINARYASFYAGEPSSNPSMGLITFRADGELELDVPEGATLLIVNSIFNGVGDVADVVLENDAEGLNNKVKELQEEVDGEYEAITPTYKNGYVTNTGSFAPYAVTGYTANSYDVSQSEKVVLKTSVQHDARYASFYAGDPSSNPSMGLITFDAEGELELDVPEGATLFIVNSVFNGVGITSDVNLENQVTEGITDKVKELQEEVDGNYEVVTPSYKNGYVTNEGGFIYTSKGAGYTANSYDVSQSEKVVLKTSVQHNARYASFYAGDPSSNPSMGLITFNAEDELDLDVPEGATLLIVNSIFNGVGDVGDVVLENQVTEGINKKIKIINNRLTEVESTVSLFDWSDKTWLMIGDSLTEKNFRAQVSYYDYVKQVTKVNLLNKGKSGDGYVHGDWFYTALGQVSDSSFDFCTMFGSGNDLRYEYTSLSDRSSWEEALGDVDDNGTMSICGYMNRAISRFFELFPLKRIGIVTPTKWKNASLGDVQLTDEETMRRMTDYSRALVQIANKWGIPVMDLFLSSGLQPQIEAYRIEFYNENGAQDPGVHPNSKGHKLIYKQFLDFLNVNLIS